MTIGIYCIEHVESGRKYIGKSINIESRWKAHKRLLSKSDGVPRGCNSYLYHTAQKYGLESLKFYILERFEFLDSSLLADREFFWIGFHDSMNRDCGFNLVRQSSIFKEMSEEATAKLSKSLTGPKNPNFGKKFSQETIDKMILARSGFNAPNFGRIFSDSSRKKMSVSKEGKSQTLEHVLYRTSMQAKYSYIQKDLNGNTLQIFARIRDVREAGFKESGVRATIRGVQPSYQGYVWERIPKVPLQELETLV